MIWINLILLNMQANGINKINKILIITTSKNINKEINSKKIVELPMLWNNRIR